MSGDMQSNFPIVITWSAKGIKQTQAIFKPPKFIIGPPLWEDASVSNLATFFFSKYSLILKIKCKTKLPPVRN